MLDRPATPATQPTFVNPPGVDDLVLRWQRDRDERARDLLTARYWSLIQSIGRRWARTWEQDSDDAIQEVAIGFLRALDLYNPELCALASYINTWGKSKVGRLRDSQSVIHVPVHARDTGRKIGKAGARLRSTLGRPPTPTELAAEIGISEERVTTALEANFMLGGIVSMSSPLGGEDGGDELGDFVPADTDAQPDTVVLQRYEVERARTAIIQAAELLPERWRTILTMRVLEGRTLNEVGERIGVTRERIRQIEVKVIECMREALRLDPRALALLGRDVDRPATVRRADSDGLSISDIIAMTGLNAGQIDHALRAGRFPRPRWSHAPSEPPTLGLRVHL